MKNSNFLLQLGALLGAAILNFFSGLSRDVAPDLKYCSAVARLPLSEWAVAFLLTMTLSGATKCSLASALCFLELLWSQFVLRLVFWKWSAAL